MNPLYRRMFQQPGMSRQPMGILASSPELANVAAQRQPLRMQQGGSATYMAAIQSLAQQGDVQTLMEIVRGNAPRDVKVAAQEAVNALSSRKEPAQISTAPRVQTAGSLASPPVMSVRGSGDTISLKAAPPMMSYDGPSEGALQRRAALADAPSKIFEGLKSGIADIKTGLTDATAPKGPVSAGTGKPSYASPAEVRAGINSFIGNTLLGPKLRRQFFAEDIKDFEPNVDARYPNGFDDPSDFEDAGIDVNLGVTTTPVGPGEAIAGSAVTGGGKDAAKETNKSKYEVVESKPKLLTPENITLIGSDTPEGNDLTLKVGESLTEAGKNISTGDLGLSSTEELVNSIFGVDDAVAAKTGKKPTKKEKVAAEMEILKEFFGKKAAKDIRTDVNYNLMMTGLLIAAGESPDAGTNIAKGLAAGLKTYGDATGEAAKQENELQQALGLQAYKNVTDEIAAEKLSAARERETKIQVSAQIATANMNNNAAAQRLSAQLGNNRDQWKAQLAQADSQFDATMEIENKKLNLEPAEIRTLKTLMKQPELIEIMQRAAEAKDPNKTYSDILTGILKSPLMMTQFTKADGSIDMQKVGALARVGAEMAPSLTIRSTGSVETSAAGAGQQTTTIPTAPSGLPAGGKYSPQTKKWYTPDSSSSTGWSEWSGQAQ
jgi:hypothetical protein